MTMLAKRARSSLTPYSLFAAKVQTWVPPDGLSLKSYDVRRGRLGITFEVILSCQCEAEEALMLRSVVAPYLWDDLKVPQDLIIDGVLASMFKEAEQKRTEHDGTAHF
jgi:hypothetical protein